MNDYSFGNFVSTLRLRRGLSQKELGALVGVSNKAVSKWENGAAKPQTEICRRLANVLGITLDELLACKYHSAKNAEKGIFAMNAENWEKARQRMLDLYGDTPPLEVLERFETEKLQFKDGNFIAVMSFLGTLANEIKAEGGVTFARGEIGNSFVAWLLGATNANPLPPHYYCSNCKQFELIPDAVDGWDLPPKRCSCGSHLKGDGHRLPSAMLYQNHWNSYEYSIPGKFLPRARELIFEIFHNSINVYRAELTDVSNHSTETFVLLPDSACSDIPPTTDVLKLDSNILYHKYGNYTRVLFHHTDWEDLVYALSRRTNWMPYQTPYLSLNAIDTVKEGGPLQPYYDRQREISAKEHPEFPLDMKRDFPHNLNTLSCSYFSDLLRILGICHGTYKDCNEVNTPQRLFTLREDMYEMIQKKLLKKGISGDGMAVKFTNLLRKGHLSEKRISTTHEQELLAIGLTPEQLEEMKRVYYLFPKAHVVNEMQNYLILGWYAVKYPEEFKAVLLTMNASTTI